MKITALLLLLTLAISNLSAQEERQESLSQQAANPLADLMSFPFQNILNMNYGVHNRNTNILNIQPMTPFSNGRIITRTIFPIVRIPDFANEDGIASSGLSDIVFTGFYAPPNQPFTWGFGPVLEIPKGGAERGTQKWSAGPSFVALLQPGAWSANWSAS